MPINSVQQHLRDALDGTVLPLYQPLTAFIEPPIADTTASPRAYIWGSTLVEKRRAAPRPQGFKRLEHNVDIWLVVFDSADSDQLDEAFPTTIDAVMQALREAPMPVTLTDPRSGIVSQLIAIGEDIKADYAPVHAVAEQRLLRFDARLIATCIEEVQG